MVILQRNEGIQDSDRIETDDDEENEILTDDIKNKDLEETADNIEWSVHA